MSHASTHSPTDGSVTEQPTHDVAAPGQRPGLIEIAVGLAIWSIGVFLLARQLHHLGLAPPVHGLVLAGLAGILGPAALAAANALRIRSLPAFGLRRVKRRWLLIGVAVGVATLVVKSLASGAWILLSGDTTNAQSEYAQAANGGALFLVLTTVFLGVLTPLGEELLFRGVVTTGLLRYGSIVGVVGSAAIFALYHGINPVLPAAFVIGLATAELYRRTGSLWPSIIVHVVVNLPAPLVSVLAGLG